MTTAPAEYVSWNSDAVSTEANARPSCPSDSSSSANAHAASSSANASTPSRRSDTVSAPDGKPSASAIWLSCASAASRVGRVNIAAWPSVSPWESRKHVGGARTGGVAPEWTSNEAAARATIRAKLRLMSPAATRANAAGVSGTCSVGCAAGLAGGAAALCVCAHFSA